MDRASKDQQRQFLQSLKDSGRLDLLLSELQEAPSGSLASMHDGAKRRMFSPSSEEFDLIEAPALAAEFGVSAQSTPCQSPVVWCPSHLVQLLVVEDQRRHHLWRCGNARCVSCPSTSRRTGAIPRWWPLQLRILKSTPIWVGLPGMATFPTESRTLAITWWPMVGLRNLKVRSSTTLAPAMSVAWSENDSHDIPSRDHVGRRRYFFFLIGTFV